jgi:D-alanine-D-alanine ligase
MSDLEKEKVLWFGGNSEERLVSVASAQNLVRQTSFEKIIFFDEKGQAFLEKAQDVLKHCNPFERTYTPQGLFLGTQALDSESFLGRFSNSIIFLGFHGGEYENGFLQERLERKKLFFTGSGSQASQRAFDKQESKKRVYAQGGGIPSGFSFDLKKDFSWKISLRQSLSQWHSLVIKPQASGSSFGLYFVSTDSELDQAIATLETQEHSFTSYLCEQRVFGRELTVGCLDQENQGKISSFMLPPSEVLLDAHRQFDYQGKYLGLGVKEITPASLSPKECEQAHKLSRIAHEAVGAYGYSRTDMILTPEGNFVFLEINTLPGLSGASFIPQQLEAQGISLKEFLKTQFVLGEKRYLEKVT